MTSVFNCGYCFCFLLWFLLLLFSVKHILCVFLKTPTLVNEFTNQRVGTVTLFVWKSQCNYIAKWRPVFCVEQEIVRPNLIPHILKYVSANNYE